MVLEGNMEKGEEKMKSYETLKWGKGEKWGLLLLGIIFTILSGYRWGVEILAWISWVPLLVYSMKCKNWKDWLLLLLALEIASNGMTAKIITEPIPFFFTFIFGIPIGFSAWLMLVIWENVRRRINPKLWIPSFVTLVIFSEWTTFKYSEFGMWGTMAVTQLNNLPLLQLASFAGISGIAAIIAAVSCWISLYLVSEDKRNLFVSGLIISFVLLFVMLYGSIRIYNQQNGKTAKVAAITTDLHITPAGFPRGEELKIGTDSLFIRSKRAALGGANLIVWNEGATLIDSTNEESLIKRGQEFGLENKVDLVMAYIVPISLKPFKFDNKYIWISDSGKILETYRKHHPVPGEGAIKGVGELLVHQRNYGKAAGAICYDYDFPEMAREHGIKEAGIVAVPSSDWYGIDPYHTQMSRIRAIEGGFSVIRPVRWATSMAFDGYGRIRAAMPYNENNRLMIVDLPTKNLNTFYSKFGDWLVIPSILFWIYLISILIRRRIK